jgi:sugar phosphate isomerase/epimerase
MSDRLGVCSWSLQAQTPAELIERIKACGVSLVSLHLDPLRTEPNVWGSAIDDLRAANIRIGSGMWACAGEDYSTLESIQRTGGIRPDETWAENERAIQENARIARDNGIDIITFHAGFLPHETDDPVRRAMIERLRFVADLLAKHRIEIGLETGQETAATLLDVLAEVDRPNLGVNFDPANMLLYGMGDPIDALRKLRPHLRQVHIKDATRSQTPGEWGAEVLVGTGEVDWEAFISVLEQTEYAGDLMIEREAGESRVEDVAEARRVLEGIA